MEHHKRLLVAIQQHQGWSYTTGNPAYPARVPGMPGGLVKRCHPTVSDTVTNCVAFTAYCIFYSYSDPVAPLNPTLWGDLCIWDSGNPWSPIEGVIAEGIGVPSTLEYPGLYLAQTWNEPLTRGHARIVRVLDDHTIEVFEASQSAGLVRMVTYPPGGWSAWGHATKVAALIP